MDELIVALTTLTMIGTIFTYAFICFEFPRRSLYDSDPFWLVIAKIWGGLFVFTGSGWFWWWFFSLLIGKK